MNLLKFKDDLTALINRHSIESGSDTPDFLLADYLMGCLATYNETLHLREKWYGRSINIKSETAPTEPPPSIG